MRVRNRYSIFLLTMVICAVAIFVLGLTIFVLFTTASEQNKRIMMSYAEHQSAMLTSVLQLVPEKQRKGAEPPDAVIDYIRQTMMLSPIVTDSGEMLFAYRDKGFIHVISPYRFHTTTSTVLPEDHPAMQALQLALDGHAGMMVTRDYRDVEVLAAFVPVEKMNLAVEVKIDLAEVRTPFVRTALYAALATFGVIIIGTVVVRKISRPLVQKLEENESKYRTLFDSANEGIMVITDRIEECNDQVTRLLGFEKHELIGRRIADFTPDRTSQGDASTEMTALNRFELAWQGKPQYFVWRSRRKDGSDIDVDVMLKKVRVGARSFILATLLDVTDRRRAEIELRRAEKQISESREHLAHVARLSTMGEMAAGIAHEINQPLAAISIYAQGSKRMIASGTATLAELEEPLEKIVTQALRAGEVIQRLRGFIKKNAGGLELVDCNALVTEVVKLAEVDSRKHNIPVYTHLADDIAPVIVDAVQLQQVILNLIRNALEAMAGMPNQRASVDVYTAQDEGCVFISVIDGGPGLSEEALQHVFDPFFTTKTEGMGLGLSISQSIINSHGGRLSVHNNVSGIGACFVITLPVSRRGAPQPAVEAGF